MELLTRAEEFVLLAVWRLQEDAYSKMIQKEIAEISGERWSLGTIYAPLERLEKRGYIISALSDTTPERGGRRKRIYRLNVDGVNALRQIRAIQKTFWKQLPDLSTEVES